MIRKLNPTLRDLIFGIGIYMLILEMIGLIFIEDKLPYTIGNVFGCAVAIGLAFSMYNSIVKALDMVPEQAQKYTTKKSILRLLVMFVAVGVGMTFNWINYVSVILGILGLKVSAFMQPFIYEYITKKIFKEGR